MCSRDIYIQIGQLIQFLPKPLTNVIVSLASSDDMTALGLGDLGVTPTECKEHLDQQAFLTNKRLGATEAMNLVITPMAFPIPPMYHALYGTNLLED